MSKLPKNHEIYILQNQANYFETVINKFASDSIILCKFYLYY